MSFGRQQALDIAGWIGMSLILLAFAFSQWSVLSVYDRSYQSMNLFGSLGIVAVSASKRAYPPLVLNAIWMLIALAALARPFFYD